MLEDLWGGHPAWDSFALLLAALAGGLVVYVLTFHLLRSILGESEQRLKIPISGRLRAPFRLIIPLLSILVIAPSLQLPPELALVLRRILSLGFIMAAAWFLVAVTLLGRDLIIGRYDVTVSDNLKARAVHTQVNVFVKVALLGIAFVASASAMMIFENIRQLGASLLASAGVIGIVVGFAAQRSIAALLAGLQVAITQPIRLDDVVIVEGEWGRIEEITLTYVVVRIWDSRRLVVPVSHFLEKPFQNWTRVSSDLLGTVFLYVDYAFPVAAVREELRKILEGEEKWDGKVWGLQVTNATEWTVELRALMSAANSSAAWDLRCSVREKLLEFLQQKCPEGLPRVRAELHSVKPEGRQGVPA